MFALIGMLGPTRSYGKVGAVALVAIGLAVNASAQTVKDGTVTNGAGGLLTNPKNGGVAGTGMGGTTSSPGQTTGVGHSPVVGAGSTGNGGVINGATGTGNSVKGPAGQGLTGAAGSNTGAGNSPVVGSGSTGNGGVLGSGIGAGSAAGTGGGTNAATGTGGTGMSGSSSSTGSTP